MTRFHLNSIRLANPRRATGFSLVEVMIGLLIGLIVTIVIFQVFEVSERQKRTTTGTSDAQGSGAIAMNMLGQSVRSTGVGIDHQFFGSCTTLRANTTSASGAAANAQLAASLFSVVSIADGGDAPDSISVLYYLPPNTDISDVRYATTRLTDNMSAPGTSTITTLTMSNCEEPPALALMVQDGDCMLMTVTAASTETASGATITKGAGANFNFPAGTATPQGFLFEKNKAALQCFPGLYRATWSINSQQLEVMNADLLKDDKTLGNKFTDRDVVPVMPNIVHMKAQYGVTSATGGIQWVNATVGEWESGSSDLGATAASDLAHVRRIRAIRVAMLARNEEYQKPGATGACDATTSAQTDTWPSWANFSTDYLASQDPDWNCYRYKAFESTIPIRNILWAN
jgi:type IV pilus assembly protein PilW